MGKRERGSLGREKWAQSDREMEIWEDWGLGGNWGGLNKWLASQLL